MRIAGILMTVALLAAGSMLSGGPSRSLAGMVTKVSDGDTIQVTDADGSVVKVRLYGIDAPETEKRNKKTGKTGKPGQPWGEEAEKTLRQKILNKRVRIDVMDIDRYKRLVSIVWLGERNVNREMVAEGLAWAYRKYLEGSPHASEFLDTEEKARKAKLGIWKEENPEPPWEFRKRLKTED